MKLRFETLAAIVLGAGAFYLVIQLALWVGRTVEAGAKGLS